MIPTGKHANLEIRVVRHVGQKIPALVNTTLEEGVPLMLLQQSKSPESGLEVQEASIEAKPKKKAKKATDQPTLLLRYTQV